MGGKNRSRYNIEGRRQKEVDIKQMMEDGRQKTETRKRNVKDAPKGQKAEN